MVSFLWFCICVSVYCIFIPLYIHRNVNLSRTLDWSMGQRDASDIIWISMNDVGASVACIHSPIFIHSSVFFVILTLLYSWLMYRVRFVLYHLPTFIIFIFLSLFERYVTITHEESRERDKCWQGCTCIHTLIFHREDKSLPNNGGLSPIVLCKTIFRDVHMRPVMLVFIIQEVIIYFKLLSLSSCRFFISELQCGVLDTESALFRRQVTQSSSY